MSKFTVNPQTGQKHTASPIMWVGAIGGVLCLIGHKLIPAIWGVSVNLNEIGWTLLSMAGVSAWSMKAKN